MASGVQYRREVSDACNWHQDQALNSTIYILYETGPTGFLLKEEEDGTSKNFKVYIKIQLELEYFTFRRYKNFYFKVFLGNVHTCSCPVFKKVNCCCQDFT